MAKTVEAFVQQLKTEGIEAGQRRAAEMIEEAKAEASRLIEEAEARAEALVRNAEAEQSRIAARTRSELQLAARDTLIKLRSTLESAITETVAVGMEQVLEKPAFLQDILRSIIDRYVETDVLNQGTFTVDLPAHQRDALVGWALGALADSRYREMGISVNLRGHLQQAGFEYRVEGATIEVTVDSVVETLRPLVDARVAELVEVAAADDAEKKGPAT